MQGVWGGASLFHVSFQEQDVLEAIIGRLLNLGKLQEAQQLVALFDYNSRELTLVLVSAWEGRGRGGEEREERWWSEGTKASVM